MSSRPRAIHQELARERKARALCKVLRKAGATPESIAALSEKGWALAASAAGVRMPSEETRAVVFAQLREQVSA